MEIQRSTCICIKFHHEEGTTEVYLRGYKPKTCRSITATRGEGMKRSFGSAPLRIGSLCRRVGYDEERRANGVARLWK